MFVFLETKEDRERTIDPRLLFPLKEWLMGFLPGHTFTWDIEESDNENVETGFENAVSEESEFWQVSE